MKRTCNKGRAAEEAVCMGARKHTQALRESAKGTRAKTYSAGQKKVCESTDAQASLEAAGEANFASVFRPPKGRES